MRDLAAERTNHLSAARSIVDSGQGTPTAT